MRFRWLALLVVVYIALDCVTPMQPGAVHLTDGSLESDTGLCGRRATDLAPPVAPLQCYLSTVVPTRQRTLQAGRVDRTPSPTPVLFRAPLQIYSAPASSLDDD